MVGLRQRAERYGLATAPSQPDCAPQMIAATAQITGSTPEEARKSLKRTRGNADEAIQLLFEDALEVCLEDCGARQ